MANETMGKQLENLKDDIMKMGCLIQEQIYKANRSLTEKDIDLAREVIDRDDLVDRIELEIEKKCLYMIACNQPMARDLRFISTCLRIIVDMERMGDHAEDIARVTIELYEQTYMKPLIDIPKMAQIAQDMVVTACKALTEENVDMAMTLVDMEKEVEALYELVFQELLGYMMRDQGNIPQATQLLLVAGHLERIADHATNIGEMVLYITQGKRVDLNVLARS